ncbi:hypothetical protein [Agrobacterium sp. CFBP2214]|uniref:hypothetical protein n=1 Tax=Agrobacterium sp. CFBP2214 TaxID=3040274 RepID=UPI000DD0523C|nr:hypothetical protein [Agrobacterium sp. CFBP2214]
MLNINFKCPECNSFIEDEVDNATFDWTNDSTGDGIESNYSTVTCTECDEDYNIEVIAMPGQKDVKVTDHPEVKVRFIDDTFDFEDFGPEDLPFDAYEVYQQSVADAKSLHTNSYKLGIPGQPLLKVLYLQYVVILEAYLSDRLIKIITNDDKKLLALVGSTEALRSSTHTLIDIAKDPNFVKRTAKKYLERVSFHDLLKVSGFYEAVLDVYIFADERPEKPKKNKKKNEGQSELTAEEQKMQQIIQIRHHIVHRNGRDNDGNFIPLKLEEVEEVAKLVNEMVERIEKNYRPYIEQLSEELDKDIPF